MIPGEFWPEKIVTEHRTLQKLSPNIFEEIMVLFSFWAKGKSYAQRRRVLLFLWFSMVFRTAFPSTLAACGKTSRAAAAKHTGLDINFNCHHFITWQTFAIYLYNRSITVLSTEHSLTSLPFLFICSNIITYPIYNISERRQVAI